MQRLLFLCVTILVTLSKKKKGNKNKEIERGLAWYVLLYTTICGMTVVHLATPQHFDHCDEELSLNSE